MYESLRSDALSYNCFPGIQGYIYFAEVWELFGQLIKIAIEQDRDLIISATRRVYKAARLFINHSLPPIVLGGFFVPPRICIDTNRGASYILDFFDFSCRGNSTEHCYNRWKITNSELLNLRRHLNLLTIFNML
jgi:hypothetical protein